MGIFAEFERALIGEWQPERIALAKQSGAYRGRNKALTSDQVIELRRRAAGEAKAMLARDFDISRETLYHAGKWHRTLNPVFRSTALQTPIR